MSSRAEEQIRWGRRWYVVGMVAPMAVAVACSVAMTALYAEPGRKPQFAVYAAYALLAGYAYVTVDWNLSQPYKWVRNVLAFGAAAIGLQVASLGGMHPPDPVGLFFFGSGLVWIAGCVAAAIGRRHATADLDAEDIVDTNLGVRFPARGGKRVSLEVDGARIQVLWAPLRRGRRWRLEQSTCLLRDVRAVGTRFVGGGPYRLPGTRGVRLRLSPGPALWLREPAGEWIFPTNGAHEACEIIERRTGLAARRLDAPAARADHDGEATSDPA